MFQDLKKKYQNNTRSIILTIANKGVSVSSIENKTVEDFFKEKNIVLGPNNTCLAWFTNRNDGGI